ncbi:MAG: V-type ATP synthase subunit D [Clostridiaceae bacterium]|jgi:V/A-type H+-transporting ATPase subunit D|nr:V-type ATP synthase subunit D [Clostridiaceae bacterium]
MDTNLFPTKGNLIIARNSLALSRQGFELLDKKRNILVRELMGMIDKAKKINDEIQVVFSEAYEALQDANISMGISVVQQIGFAIPEEESIQIRDHSVMGVEIPVIYVNEKNMQPHYGFRMTNGTLDLARKKFEKVKILSVKLAEIENSIYRLAKNIRRTMKRTNALKNIIIPKYESICSTIENVLEEKEREEFSRLKVIKGVKENKDKF